MDARTAKRWMAISVDPALEREEPPKESLEAVAVSDFLKAWGAAEGKPQAAYRLPAGETDWTVSTRPHEPRSTADQIADAHLRRGPRGSGLRGPGDDHFGIPFPALV